MHIDIYVPEKLSLRRYLHKLPKNRIPNCHHKRNMIITFTINIHKYLLSHACMDSSTRNVLLIMILLFRPGSALWKFRSVLFFLFIVFKYARMKFQVDHFDLTIWTLFLVLIYTYIMECIDLKSACNLY